MFTTKDGAKLIAPGRQESMHFETALTFSRKSVRLHRQAGQTLTGKDNSTPELTQQRWRIEIPTAPPKDKETQGLTCPLIHAIGFAPTIQHHSANNLERAPQSRSMDLEDVILTEKSTITEATKRLKLTATINNGETTKLLPRDQALANFSEGQWKDFKFPRN